MKDCYLRALEDIDKIKYEQRIKIIQFVRELRQFQFIAPKFFYLMQNILFCTQIPSLFYFIYSCILPVLGILYVQDFFICLMMLDITVK